MVDMRLVVSHNQKTKQLTLSDEQARKLRGRKIGEHFKGDGFGLPGYVLEIRGGTDKDGFPMRGDLHGSVRKRLLLSSGPGYKPKKLGIRKRKMIRGATIDTDISQLNVIVIKEGKKPVEELLAPPKKEDAKE